MEEPVAPKTILVVDDEDGVRESVRVVGASGYVLEVERDA